MLQRVLGFVKTQTTIRYSKLECASSAAMVGLTDQYIVPYAVAMRASEGQVGLLTSIPNLVAACTLLGVPRLVRRLGSRKAVLLTVVFLHALVWLPVLLVPILFPSQMILSLFVFAILLEVLSDVADTSWNSILADVVPKNRINRYFSMRGIFQGVVALAAALVAGYVLHAFPSGTFVAFGVIFFLAMGFRLASVWFLTQVREPRLQLPDDPSYGFWAFAQEVGRSSVGRLILLVGLMTLAATVAAPFYAVYVLRDLHFSPTLYSVFVGVGYLAALVSLNPWGLLADRIGNMPVVLITALLAPLGPLLWLVSSDPLYLVLVQAFSSVAWAGFSLAAANYIFRASSPQKKLHFIAYFNVLSLLGQAGGPLLGSWFASALPPIVTGANLLGVFLASGALRLGIALAFIPFMVESIRIELPVPRGFRPVAQYAVYHAGILARVRRHRLHLVRQGAQRETLYWAGQPLRWRGFRVCRDCVTPSWMLRVRRWPSGRG